MLNCTNRKAPHSGCFFCSQAAKDSDRFNAPRTLPYPEPNVDAIGTWLDNVCIMNIIVA